MRNVLAKATPELGDAGGTAARTGRTEEGSRLGGTVTLSSASCASSPLAGVLGALVMLMLRCSFRTSRLYCSTCVPFSLRGDPPAQHTGPPQRDGDPAAPREMEGTGGDRCHLGSGWFWSVTKLLWSCRLL